MRKTIPQNILRRLYAHSGNQCAYPGCSAPLFEDNGLLTGECCHIEAYSPLGARYNPQQSDEERNGFNNLLLLCSRHHKIVDSDINAYTVEILKRMKNDHEMKYDAGNLVLTENQLKSLQIATKLYWKRIEEIDKKNPELLDFKRFANINESLEELLAEIEHCWEYIEDIYKTISQTEEQLPKMIRNYLVKIGYNPQMYDEQDAKGLNPFFLGLNWELLNLGVNNCSTDIVTLYFEIIIRLLERISELEGKEHHLLNKYRERFAEFQKHNYYVD